jgi:hypothetical protein
MKFDLLIPYWGIAAVFMAVGLVGAVFPRIVARPSQILWTLYPRRAMEVMVRVGGVIFFCLGAALAIFEIVHR